MPLFSCAKRTLITAMVMGALAFVATAAIVGILFASYGKKVSESEHDAAKLKFCFEDLLTTDDQCDIFPVDIRNETDNFSIPSESRIAHDGHLMGAIPLHYNWTINFKTKEQFVGTVNMAIKIKMATKRIAFHADDALTLDYQNIQLRSCGSREVVCIEKVTFLKNAQMVILDLKRVLKAKFVYTLRVNSVEGSVYSSEGGSSGLRLNNANSPNWAITTIFQMRLARTVFPCFDHPSLKANFTICAEHSSDTEAYSNTEVEKMFTADGSADRVQECYQQTPKIPTYVVTVSLMGNFSKHEDDSVKPKIDLFYSNDETLDTFKWELNLTRQILEVFDNTFKLNFNLSKLGLINVNPGPFWGVENFGLITLESGFTRFSETERGRSILIHEIIHQWLGDVVTVTHWNEICLQEGLTAYLEMLLSERLNITPIPVSLQIRGIVSEYLAKDHSKALIQPYNLTQDIADHCFGKPVVFLHTIADGYGGELWISFLQKLVEKFPYSTAGLDDWINLLEETSGSKEPGAILKSWFEGVGYPLIFASTDSFGRINLEQKIFINEASDNKTKPFVPKSARLIPTRVMTNSSLSPVILIDSVRQTITLDNSLGSNWILVDPMSATFSRKVYTVQNYLSIVECFYESGKNDCQISAEQVQSIFSDFCFAMMEDQIPSTSDVESPKSDTIQKWESIVDKLRNLTSNASGRKRLVLNRCECCFKSEQEIVAEKFAHWHPNSCKGVWNEYCRPLSLMKLIGRDYIIPEQ